MEEYKAATEKFNSTIECLEEDLERLDKEQVHICADEALLIYLKETGQSDIANRYIEVIDKVDDFWYA